MARTRMLASNTSKFRKEVKVAVSASQKGQVTKLKNQSINSKDDRDEWCTSKMAWIWNRVVWHNLGRTRGTSSSYEQRVAFPLREETRAAIKQLKCEKSPGLDGIPAKLYKYSGNVLHYLCTKIWETCTWPDEWKLQEFVLLNKKGNTKDCGNYRTIALISHASRILLIIILNRTKV